MADHAIHLPFWDMASHPQRWRGDLLLQAYKYHHSLLWALQAPFARALGFAPWAALLHALSTAAMGAVAFRTGLLLWSRRDAAWLAVAATAPAHAALGGAATWDPLVLSRTVALPVELAALLLLLGGRPTRALLLLGLALNLHAPSAAAAGFAAGALWLARRPRSLRPALGWALGATPVLLRWLTADRGPAMVDDAWWQIIEARLAHHLLPLSWPAPQWLLALAWTAAGLLVWRRLPSPSLRRDLAVLAVALLTWGLLGLALGAGARVALALQLEPAQAHRIVIWATAAALPGALPRRRGLLLALLALLWLEPHTPQSGVASWRWLPAGPPGVALPLEAGHSAPPVEVNPSDAGARLRRGGPVFVTWKDGGEALFHRELALEWRRRVEETCACRPFVPRPTDDGTAFGRAHVLRKRIERGWRVKVRSEMASPAETWRPVE